MGGVCRDPEGQYFFWRPPCPLTTQAHLVSFSNPTEGGTINYLKLGALLIHILFFSPRMVPLAHIHTYVDNMAAQVWDNRGSIIIASSVRPILQELHLAARWKIIHASVGRVLGEDNNIADATSRLTHLPDRQFIFHFRTHFPQSKPWRLHPLPSW